MINAVLPSNEIAPAAERDFFIPRGSHVITFSALQPNIGSGEWWFIGEDSVNYYALDDIEPGCNVLKKTDLPDGVSELDKAHRVSPAVFRPMPYCFSLFVKACRLGLYLPICFTFIPTFYLSSPPSLQGLPAR